MKRFLLFGASVTGVMLLTAIALAQISSCPTLNCWLDGTAPTAMGDRVTIGGSLDITTGGDLDVEAGATLNIAGTAITASAAELNQAADNSASVEVVAATNVITAAESGATFFLNDTTEFASTLPALAAGLRYTFIVAAAPSGANYTIVTDGGDNVLNIVAQTGEAASVALVATGQDLLTLVSALAVVGDWIYCISDGTSWQCKGGFAVAAGLTSGAS